MLRRILVPAIITSVSGLIQDCGSIFQITRLGLTPDPPVRGQPVYMDLQFINNGAPVVDGTVRTTATYNGIPVAIDPAALCSQTACPIGTGYNNRSTTTTWPDNLSGKLSSKITWLDPVSQQLLCLQTTVRVGSSIAEPAGEERAPRDKFRLRQGGVANWMPANTSE